MEKEYTITIPLGRYEFLVERMTELRERMSIARYIIEKELSYNEEMQKELKRILCL